MADDTAVDSAAGRSLAASGEDSRRSILLAAVLLGVLVGVDDVAVELEDEVGHGGDEPALVGARHQQGGSGGEGSHRTAQIRRPRV